MANIICRICETPTVSEDQQLCDVCGASLSEFRPPQAEAERKEQEAAKTPSPGTSSSAGGRPPDKPPPPPEPPSIAAGSEITELRAEINELREEVVRLKGEIEDIWANIR